MAKHFIKTLIIFSVMIIIGLIGVFLVSYFNKQGSTVSTSDDSTAPARAVAN
jgi:hypothetical protein